MRLTPVTRDDVVPLVRMQLRPDQAGTVAPNAVSLAQAPYETGCYVYVIWAGEARVGFVSLLDNTEHDFLDPEDDPQAAFMWRLMIDAPHQRRGYARAAVGLVQDWARARGLRAVVTTVVAGNAAAAALYHGCGFTPTGLEYEGEIELRCVMRG